MMKKASTSYRAKGILLLLLTLTMCLCVTGCGDIWDYLWERTADTEVDSGMLVIHGSEGAEETMEIFEGAVIYTGEAHSGTDIYYIGTGSRRSRIIVIDAGHQAKENLATEPNGPDASAISVKMDAGTTGVQSGTAEHQLNLDVSLLLRDRLIERGYSVVMIRETADVDISDMERAQIANKYSAAAYVKIHANASDDASINGARTVCQSRQNPYPDCAAMYEDSRMLSEEILEEYCDTTGMERLLTLEKDGITGINWSKVPTVVLEMGYMTNEGDDMLMALDFFKQRAAAGIANGIDAYIDVVEMREEESDTGAAEDQSEAERVDSNTPADTYADPETQAAVETAPEAQTEESVTEAEVDGTAQEPNGETEAVSEAETETETDPQLSEDEELDGGGAAPMPDEPMFSPSAPDVTQDTDIENDTQGIYEDIP